MNYEQKYKEALERAKEKRDEYKRLDGEESFVPSDIEYIFPELHESEDEKIRNEIILYIGNKDIDLSTHNRWLAWLEKQGETKPWSEEDEKMLNSIIEEIRPFGECPDYPTDEDREYYYSRAKMIDWLKSIKPNNWKPSEEHFRALFYAIEYFKKKKNDTRYLESLYDGA